MRGALLVVSVAAGLVCWVETPGSAWTRFGPLVHCQWNEEAGVCARRGAEEGRGVAARWPAEPAFVELGEGWALNTELEARTSVEVPDDLVDWGRLGSGLTVAAVVALEVLPRGRMALVSKWETRESGRSFELGMEWDGRPYFMVSGNGETSDLGIVYAEGPVRDHDAILLVGVWDPEAGLSVHVNGELVGANRVRFPGRLHVSSAPLLVGRRSGCADGCAFDGAVGDVALFDQALESGQILELAAALGTDGPAQRALEEPAPVVFDLDAVGRLVRGQLVELDSGEGPGRYRWNPTDREPQLYSSADVAWIRWIMGELGELDDEERAAWVDYIRSHQDERGGGYPEAAGHDALHALAHVTAALRMLGAGHAHPVTFHRELLDPAVLGPWLDGRDWFYQWGSSCSIWGLGLVALSTETTPASWRERLFEWLDAELDPEVGAWRRGREVRHRVDYLGGGFHIWALYVLDGRPIPMPEAAVDLVLSLQTGDGDFHRLFGCGVLDGVWVLATLMDQTDYRRRDVEVALRRSLHGLMELVDRGLFHDTASHGLLSRVATMALLQRALPGELVSERSWRDPWTDPSLFDLE